MNKSKLKKVGELNGEAVYELPADQIKNCPSGEGWLEIKKFCQTGQKRCLSCIFNSFIDISEELEAFVTEKMRELSRLDDIRIDDGVTFLHVQTSKDDLLTDIALAFEGLVMLRALIGTAVRVL